MGYPMAENLARSLTSADTLSVYDVNSSALDSFKSGSSDYSCAIEVAPSSTAAILSSETVITMLPNTSHVEGVFAPFLGDSAAEHGGKLDGKLFIDSSTISPASTKSLSDGLRKHGATLVDAPVSGGVVGAQARTLTFMISQPPSIPFETLEKLLQTMGKRIVVCGSYPGAGLAAKLANNYALALNNLATCDAMLLGQKLGLDPKVLAEVLNTSTGRSWPSEANNPVPGVLPNSPSSKGYEGGFGIALMRKDLDLALEADRKSELVAGDEGGMSGKLSPLSEAALRLYKEVEADERFGKKDFSVVYEYLRTQQ